MTNVIDRLINGRRRVLWSMLVLLIFLVLVSFASRLAADVPNIATGTVPGPEVFEHRYALHPVAFYGHLVPGVVYLVGAPFQLWQRFRNRHLVLHRRLGRVLLVSGLVAGVLSVVVGVWYPFGGWLEASASLVFGLYFVAALVIAFLAIRGRDIARHRRWMIRAFAVAVGVGTVRIWLLLFQSLGVLGIEDNAGTEWFGVAFWLGFVGNALAAEVYLAWRPRTRPALSRVSAASPGR